MSRPRLDGATRTMLGNAASLVSTTAVTAALGYAYWWVAARSFSAADVGLAAAAISAMMLLGALATLGLNTLLIRELPRSRGNVAGIAIVAVAGTAGIGSIAGMLFAGVLPALDGDLAVIAAGADRVLVFGIGVGLTAATIVLDAILLAIGSGTGQLVRNTLFAITKLALIGGIALAGVGDGIAIYATWLGGNLLSLVMIVRCLGGARGSLGEIRSQAAGLVRLGSSALSHHLLNVIFQAPTLILPLVVTATLSATVNGYFYGAWMIASLLFAGPLALATAAFAAGSRDPAALPERMRWSVGIASLAGLAGNAVLVVAAHPILGLLGSAYADEAASSLRVLGLGVFAYIIKDHYVTLRRIDGRLRLASLLLAVDAVIEIGFAAIGAQFGGLLGLSVGWLIANLLTASLFAPAVIRAMLAGRSPTPHPGRGEPELIPL